MDFGKFNFFNDVFSMWKKIEPKKDDKADEKISKIDEEYKLDDWDFNLDDGF